MNVLISVSDTANLTVNDTFAYNRLVNQGHTVNYIAGTTTPSLSGVNLIVITSSTTAQIGTKYDTATCGVLSFFSDTVPQTGYMNGTNGGSGSFEQSWVNLASGDPIAGGLTGTTTILTAAPSVQWYWNFNTNFGSGVVGVFTYSATKTTRYVVSRYEANAAMYSGTAAGRRAMVNITKTTNFSNLNTSGLSIFDAAITWSGTVAPSSSFIFTPTTGNAPLAVSFTDTSNMSPSSWSWDFGDSGTSTVQNPSHTYTNSGTYTITLTAVSSGTSYVSTRSIVVTATIPIANAGSNMDLVAAGTPTSTAYDVGLTGSATDTNSGTLSYAWSVLTDTTGTATLINNTTATPTLRVTKYGAYVSVGLIVTNNTTSKASIQSTATIYVGSVPSKQIVVSGSLVKRQVFTVKDSVLG